MPKFDHRSIGPDLGDLIRQGGEIARDQIDDGPIAEHRQQEVDYLPHLIGGAMLLADDVRAQISVGGGAEGLRAQLDRIDALALRAILRIEAPADLLDPVARRVANVGKRLLAVAGDRQPREFLAGRAGVQREAFEAGRLHADEKAGHDGIGDLEGCRSGLEPLDDRIGQRLDAIPIGNALSHWGSSFLGWMLPWQHGGSSSASLGATQCNTMSQETQCFRA